MQPTDPSLPTRTLLATLVYTESGKREQRTLTYQIHPDQQKYVIVKVFVVELNRDLVFDKETNEFLIPGSGL
jgi:hypothetical protein